MLAELSGFVIAFVAAATATFLDMYFTLAKSLARVPGLILTNSGILGLSALCGAIAVIAFGVTSPEGTDVISTAITLKQTNPISRGLVVGATVLVIIRSKLFNIKDSGFGGEAIYTLLRSLAIQSVTDKHAQNRTKFLNTNISAAFAIPTYFTQLESSITVAMMPRSPELKQRASDELKAVKASAPTAPMAQTDVTWSNYYYSMTGICYDYCGPGVLKTYAGFRMP
jgi:hypothetical protein